MVRDIGLVWLHSTISQRFLKVDLTGFSYSSVRCFHRLLKKENPGLPCTALHDLAKSKDRNNICVEIFAKGRTRDNGQGSGFSAGDNIRGHVPGNTYNYQTANRKLKIVAPNIHPVKCYYNTSTHICFLPVWHPAEVKRVWHSLSPTSFLLFKSPKISLFLSWIPGPASPDGFCAIL